MHPDGTPLRATAILRGGGGCVGREGERGTGREWDYAHLEAPTPVDGPAAAAQRCWILGILVVVRYRNRLD